MREWNHELGVVDTIYEEEDDQEEDDLQEEKKLDGDVDSLSVSPSLTTTPSQPLSSSPSFLSPTPSLDSTVQEWTKSTGYKTDVVIRVHDRCFHLHRDPLISRSGYLRRQLTESSTVTISPPSTITAETFSDISVYCYSSVIELTPSNLAAVKTAAEWLKMDDDHDGRGNGNLTWLAEDYYAQEVATDAANAKHVLGTCAALLPAAAPLAVRCLEALAGGDDDTWMDELTVLTVDGLTAIAESMRTWFAHDHDLLYRIVDHYLLKQKHKEKLSEEERIRICSNIDCTNLSNRLLLHLVQNPRLPLRFVVQAMLLDQLHTRHTFLHLSTSSATASAAAQTTKKLPRSDSPAQSAVGPGNGITLGTILKRDAALREASHLRASMQATAFRIDSLERDLDGLRRRLRWSEEKRAEVDSARSSSFRILTKRSDVAIEERRSSSTCKGEDAATTATTPRKGFGRRLMNGLKNVFRPPPSAKGDDVAESEERRGRPRHRRNSSFTY